MQYLELFKIPLKYQQNCFGNLLITIIDDWRGSQVSNIDIF